VKVIRYEPQYHDPRELRGQEYLACHALHDRRLRVPDWPDDGRKTLRIQDEEVNCFLWKQLQVFPPLYAQSASTALIVVAIDYRGSFRGNPTWTGLLNRSCDKPPPALLLNNKMDCAGSAAIAKEEIKERYAPGFQPIFRVSTSTANSATRVSSRTIAPAAPAAS
jgi:hypothetical protein